MPFDQNQERLPNAIHKTATLPQISSLIHGASHQKTNWWINLTEQYELRSPDSSLRTRSPNSLTLTTVAVNIDDVIHLLGADDDLIEDGHAAADQGCVGSLGHHGQPPV